MSQKTDWLPANREGQLAMAKDWLAVLAVKSTIWNITDAEKANLAAHAEDAENALATAKNETARTPVATALCKAAFEALITFMRDMKKRHFLTPPLLDSDYISLGLKPRDSTPTKSGTPTAQVTIETYLVGRHELGVRIIYVTGNPNDHANKGYRLWYMVVAQGEIPPTDPEDLRKSFFTKRKKDLIEFDFGDSGKTAYFAVQIENEGKKGPWGPLVSALIP